MFALLPYTVERISVDPQLLQSKAGDTIPFDVNIDITGGKPGRHVVRLDFYSPQGGKVKYYRQIIDVHNGKGVVRLKTALNEEKGQWKVTATDVATGKSGLCNFRID